MNDASFSLTLAIGETLRAAGQQTDIDEIHALLGLSTLITAASHDPDPMAWTGYARDAFLIPASKALGMSIRQLHPPEAAVGLGSAEAYRQHFDASYRPLIARALENDQPVLAWSGWDGRLYRSWGRITNMLPDSDLDHSVALSGTISSGGAQHAFPTPVRLVSPPLQVYVVESIAPETAADASSRFWLALQHASSGFSESVCRRFDVATGARAVAQWASSIKSKALGSMVAPRFVSVQVMFATSVLSSYASATRFIQRYLNENNDDCGAAINTVLMSCTHAGNLLSDLANDSRARQIFSSREGMANVVSELDRLQHVQHDIHAVLSNALKTRGESVGRE
ncbi:MAG: hypothetical protein ACYTHJ_14285 [Planctomycetota bacterium]|jgi:hypothetical protein